jgi:catechol 2,3-dioxygenase-like lactoylglutathione lyase family enzyme
VPINRLNHAVLYVRDLTTSVAFYRDVLGFREVMGMPGRASFLQAEGSTNDHDLGLFAIGSAAGASAAGRGTVGLYGLELEVHWVVPADLIDQAVLDGRARIVPLDLPAAKERFGAHTPGGIGISQPAHA